MMIALIKTWDLFGLVVVVTILILLLIVRKLFHNNSLSRLNLSQNMHDKNDRPINKRLDHIPQIPKRPASLPLGDQNTLEIPDRIQPPKATKDDSVIDVTGHGARIPPPSDTEGLTKYGPGVPLWRHQYVYASSEIRGASKQQRDFYFQFRDSEDRNTNSRRREPKPTPSELSPESWNLRKVPVDEACDRIFKGTDTKTPPAKSCRFASFRTRYLPKGVSLIGKKTVRTVRITEDRNRRTSIAMPVENLPAPNREKSHGSIIRFSKINAKREAQVLHSPETWTTSQRKNHLRSKRSGKLACLPLPRKVT